ncbi:hypothetical protein J3A83DRAFT_4191420 [Scleroderma citrinum]
MAQGQFNREEALATLNQHWHKGMAGYNNQEGVVDPEKTNQKETEKQTTMIWECLENFKFIHMWYFTRDSLCKAAKTVWCLDKNETLAITQAVKGNVAVRTANSLITSKNVKLDHHLTYAKYMFTKNHFLMAIENAKWGNDIVDSYNWFFHNLDNHPLQDTGDRVYEDLMNKIAQELDSRDIQLGLEQPGDLGPASPGCASGIKGPNNPTVDDQSHLEDVQGPHDGARVMKEKSNIPFDRSQHQSVQNAWAGTRNIDTEPPVMNCPYGTNPTLPTAPETTKAGWSTEMAKSFAGTSSDHGAAQVFKLWRPEP